MKTEANAQDKPPTRLIPISEWSKYHVWPTVPAMRSYAYEQKTNGMEKHRVVKRVGRRVLIDEAAFFRWVDARTNEDS